ncbi:MAG: phosphatase PAP2 family protein [Pseudomonadota bacterium]
MIRHLLTAAAVLTLSACATASAPTADDASMGPKPTKLTGYFTANPLDGKAILGPPPAVDSPHGKADRTLFEETRKLEGSARWKTAIQDNDLWGGGAIRRFSCAVGVKLDEKTTPRTLNILHRVELDVRTVGTPAKDFYDRKRPLIGNDAPLCVPREDWMRTNASYPSGHSMTAWAWALILTELSPGAADKVLTLGRESGESRVICGVHFISDVEAGRSLGSAMVARLHSDPTFVADMAAARREMSTVKAKPEGCDA